MRGIYRAIGHPILSLLRLLLKFLILLFVLVTCPMSRIRFCRRPGSFGEANERDAIINYRSSPLGSDARTSPLGKDTPQGKRNLALDIMQSYGATYVVL